MYGEVREHLAGFWWFLPQGHGDWIQVVRLCGKHLYGPFLGTLGCYYNLWLEFKKKKRHIICLMGDLGLVTWLSAM